MKTVAVGVVACTFLVFDAAGIIVVFCVLHWSIGVAALTGTLLASVPALRVIANHRNEIARIEREHKEEANSARVACEAEIVRITADRDQAVAQASKERDEVAAKLRSWEEASTSESAQRLAAILAIRSELNKLRPGKVSFGGMEPWIAGYKGWLNSSMKSLEQWIDSSAGEELWLCAQQSRGWRHNHEQIISNDVGDLVANVLPKQAEYLSQLINKYEARRTG